MTDANTTTRTRRRAMLWTPVTDKQPEFDREYFLLTDKQTPALGSLHEIKTTSTGRVYSWSIDGVEEPVSYITHYCEIVKP